MPDIFDVLAADHQEVKQMLARLQKSRPRRGASDDALAKRKEQVEQLIIEESKHEALEEMYFWPAVRDKLPDGDELADTATGQEQEAKQVLNKLSKLDAGDAKFEKLLAEFTESGREHIEFEETQVWPKLRKALSKKEASEIGTKVRDGKETAPTRPHPATPPRPGVLKSAGPAVAAADKARDAATGRGKANGQVKANGQTRAELYQEARKLGIEGRSAMNKDELARRVTAARRK
ncbi:MAG TPA: hemerythrin domain-containing protein [Streptosporangiaceae bacterium]|nr:hemerythrin domain-containing protein [Streptosporangiaceae bacterium]